MVNIKQNNTSTNNKKHKNEIALILVLLVFALAPTNAVINVRTNNKQIK